MQKTILSFLIVLMLTGMLQGCAAILVGGTAVTATAVHDRRTLGVFIEDQSIEFKAKERLAADTEIKNNSKISITSYNLVVLMTGQANNETLKARAERIVAAVDRVRRVVNEVELGSHASLGERSRDTALTSEVKLRMSQIEITGFDPTRVKVVSERGVVYLMGLLTRDEADAVVEMARHVAGVRRVVKVFEYL
jgi:osmotically-inducible protein OsmY